MILIVNPTPGHFFLIYYSSIFVSYFEHWSVTPTNQITICLDKIVTLFMLWHEVEPFTANLDIAYKLICIIDFGEFKFNNNFSILLLLLFFPLNLLQALSFLWKDMKTISDSKGAAVETKM